MGMAVKFHQAVERVQARFYRRFPNAPTERWDTTNIKSRWYGRKACHIKRNLGA